MKQSIPAKQLTVSDYDSGSLHWLPALDKVPLEHLYATVHIDPGCFNHPVVILWVDPQKTEAIILIITSFSGTDLLRRHPHDTRVRSLHLPIHPSVRHPDNGALLRLKDGAQLQRNSYVKTEHQRAVNTVLLRPMRQGKCTLKKKSLRKLLRHIDFHPPVTPSQQKTHDTNMPRDYGEWPDLVDPAVSGRVESPPEWCSVVNVQQALPPRQIEQAPRPQHVEHILPPHHIHRPVTIPSGQHSGFNFSYTPARQMERTPLLQTVQPVPRNIYQPYTRTTRSQSTNEGCSVGNFVVLVVLAIIVWGLWWMGKSE